MPGTQLLCRCYPRWPKNCLACDKQLPLEVNIEEFLPDEWNVSGRVLCSHRPLVSFHLIKGSAAAASGAARNETLCPQSVWVWRGGGSRIQAAEMQRPCPAAPRSSAER